MLNETLKQIANTFHQVSALGPFGSLLFKNAWLLKTINS